MSQFVAGRVAVNQFVAYHCGEGSCEPVCCLPLWGR